MKENHLSNVEVSIVIRTKNEGRFIERILKKIFSQKFKHKFEVLIIDTGSEDDTVKKAKKFPCRIIDYTKYNKKFSWGKALNFGAKHSLGKYVINTSAHCLPVDDFWIENFHKKIKENDYIAVIGRQVPEKGLDPFEEVEVEMWFTKKNGVFSNANNMINRDFLLKNPFDEKVTSLEDGLWYRKMIHEGYKIAYSTEASVYHSHEMSFHHIYRRWYGRGAMNYKIFNLKEGKIIYFIIRYLRFIIKDVFYFLDNGYYKELLAMPFYEFLRQYARYKGGKDAIEKPNIDSYFVEVPNLKVYKILSLLYKHAKTN